MIGLGAFKTLDASAKCSITLASGSLHGFTGTRTEIAHILEYESVWEQVREACRIVGPEVERRFWKGDDFTEFAQPIYSGQELKWRKGTFPDLFAGMTFPRFIQSTAPECYGEDSVAR